MKKAKCNFIEFTFDKNVYTKNAFIDKVKAKEKYIYIIYFILTGHLLCILF